MQMFRKLRDQRGAAGTIIMTVVLVILAGVLVVSLFVARKFALINTVELDMDNVKTSAEVNTSEVLGETAQGDVAEAEEQTAEADVSSPYSGIQMIALVGVDTREANDAMNSDTMIIACINHDEKTIKLASIYRDTYLNVGENQYGITYDKANAAYNYGGPEEMLTMMNLNLDLNITQFATVDFGCLTKTIDLLGGLDIDLTREEIIHLNNYNVETSEAAGVEYEEVELPPETELDGAKTMTFHLNGSQSVSYARIRYTTGNDFRRAARQRLVIEKIMEKAKTAGLGTINSVLDTVLPNVTTNLTSSEIIDMAQYVLNYSITDQTGFPFDHVEGVEVDGLDCVLPVTLKTNVIQLHLFFQPGVNYTPSATVEEYSEYITMVSGYGEEDIPQESESGEIPTWTQELQDQQDAADAANGTDSSVSADDSYSDESYYDESYYDENYYDDGSYSEESYYEEESY